MQPVDIMGVWIKEVMYHSGQVWKRKVHAFSSEKMTTQHQGRSFDPADSVMPGRSGF